MGMFDSYENLGNNYIPNNTTSRAPQCTPDEQKIAPCKIIKPYEEYNAKGELVGYYWYYGDTVNLEFTIEGEVVVTDSEISISAESFMKDKIVRVELFDFRHESIAVKTFEGSTIITFEIDEKLSKQMAKGTYYCSLTVLNKASSIVKVLYDSSDCVLLVK